MKKNLIVGVLLILAGAILVYLFTSRSDYSSPQPEPDSYAGWGSYADNKNNLSFRYPPGFIRQTDQTGNASFINKGITQASQPAFISYEILDNPANLSLAAWWDDQVKKGNRTVIPSQQRVEPDRVIGGKPMIAVIPLELGSSNYLFALGSKIVSLHGFLVEPDIDKIIASFQLETGEAPANGPITIQGTMVCLPHKNPGEFQTLECAFGLKDDNDRYFALRDTDPAYGNVSSVPTNSRAEVTGTFTAQDDTKYQSIGVIAVTRISQQ